MATLLISMFMFIKCIVLLILFVALVSVSVLFYIFITFYYTGKIPRTPHKLFSLVALVYLLGVPAQILGSPVRLTCLSCSYRSYWRWHTGVKKINK